MPTESVTSELALRRLADRLVLEYAGALPPGQVLSTVYRTNWILSTGSTVVPRTSRLVTLEAVVRRLLTDRLAALSAKPHQRVLSTPA